MKNQKGISTLAGIIIIIVVAVVLVGGVFAYQYLATQKADNQLLSEQQTQNQQQNTEDPLNVDINILSNDKIIDSIEKIFNAEFTKNDQGKYEAISEQTQSSSYINSITKGDLNNDGIEDAFVWGTGCGASCGSFFIVVINHNENLVDSFSVSPEDFVMSGAAQYAVKDISIDSGIISINARVPNFDGTTVDSVFNYHLVGNNLSKINN